MYKLSIIIMRVLGFFAVVVPIISKIMSRKEENVPEHG